MSNLPSTYVAGFHDLEAVRAMKYNPLGKTGLMVSKLSLGAAPLGIHYGDYDEATVIEMVKTAIKQGVNYIDTAPFYGQGKSETTLGKALKDVPRQAYYIATKVGRYSLDYANMIDFSKEKTRKSFHESLSRLGLDYVDIIQVHDIEFAPSLDIIITETLPELSTLVANKKAKFIGVTGYPISLLKECIERSNINISCVLSYARLTLIDESLTQYIPFFKELNLGIINAAAPGMGLLTNKGPQSWHPADEDVKDFCAKAGQYCEERGVEMGKLAVWHALKFADIATHLIGIRNIDELNMNIDSLRNGLTPEEKQVFQEIEEKYLSKVKNRCWEGKEVAAYRKFLNRKN